MLGGASMQVNAVQNSAGRMAGTISSICGSSAAILVEPSRPTTKSTELRWRVQVLPSLDCLRTF